MTQVPSILKKVEQPEQLLLFFEQRVIISRVPKALLIMTDRGTDGRRLFRDITRRRLCKKKKKCTEFIYLLLVIIFFFFFRMKKNLSYFSGPGGKIFPLRKTYKKDPLFSLAE